MKLEFNKKTFSEILIHEGGGGGGIREFEERIGAKKVKSVIEFKISHMRTSNTTILKFFVLQNSTKKAPAKTS